MYILSILDYIRPWIQPICVLVGTIVACIGVSAWKKQLAGQRDHDLAKSLLKEIYRYKNQFPLLRYPRFVTDYSSIGQEMPKQTEPLDIETCRSLSREYEGRWKPLKKIQKRLRELMLEASVVLGDEINVNYQKLNTLESKIQSAIWVYQIYLSPEPNSQQPSKPDYAILFDEPGKKDAINLELESIVKDIKFFLDPLLFSAKNKKAWWDRVFCFMCCHSKK